MKIIYALFTIVLTFIVGCQSSNLVDPTTKISYTIEEKSYVKLEVENSYNTIIKTLVDEEQDAGNYSVQFNASNLAEGVYFYTLEATGIDSDYYHEETKNLLLVK